MRCWSASLVSHWDKDRPTTLSAAGIGRLRKRLPGTLLITDDMQMQGLQKALGTGRPACIAESRHDMLCIGNNLFDQGRKWRHREGVEQRLRDKTLSGSAIEK